MTGNLDKQEALIWKEALEYAYKQDVNLWKKTRNFVKYAIEYKGVLYPNKFIIYHCEEYIKKTYPDFEFVVPDVVGKKLNAYLKSKGATPVIMKNSDNKVNNTMNDIVKKIPLNQILFGAPGTGKTYNTKRIAVEIIKGKKERTREEINVEYERLVDAKQIVFTTFHQSLSYEDFIEGIKPETIDGNVTYEVKDGIFKSLCKTASIKQIKSDNFDTVYMKLLNEIDKSPEKK